MGARYIHIVWYYESNIMNDKYHHIYSLHLRNNFNKQLNWYDKFGRLFAFNLTIVSILINNFTRNIIFSSKFPNIVLKMCSIGINKKETDNNIVMCLEVPMVMTSTAIDITNM